VITAQPSPQTAILGQQAIFSARATGTPAPTYQWLNNGQTIPGATSTSYLTPLTTKSDQNNLFIVVATNGVGTVSSTGAALTVQWAPVITSNPTPQVVTAGSTATFTVAADVFPAPTIQWQKNGQNVTGANSASYTTPATTLADSGATYLAVLTNAVGSQSSNSALLTVNPLPTPATITTQPQDSAVLVGQTTQFSVVAAGTAPLSYQWNKGPAAIPGATFATLPFPSVALTDAGSYTVVVNNTAGIPVSSNPATLTVSLVPVAPSLTTQPPDLTVTEGNAASLQVVATGTAPLRYQWQRNQTDILGATSDILVLPAVAITDNGTQFRCRVTNSVAEVYSNGATLTVLASVNPPVIISFGATPSTIVLGDTTRLTWGVTAARSLAIDNGVGDVTGLSGATVTPTQAGPSSYTLTATNAAGTSTAVAPVTVNAGPSFLLSVTLGQGITGHPAAGSNSYVQGTAATYAYALSPGLSNLQVAIDGANVNASGTLLMNGNHTLIATAQTQMLTITASGGVGGSINPAGPVSVPYGQGASFTITPDTGFNIADVRVDGLSVGTPGQFSLSNIISNHTITVAFIQTFPLTVNLGPGVTGTPSSGLYPAGPVAYAFSTLAGYTGLTVTEDADPTLLPASGSVLMDAPHSLNASAQLQTFTITTSVSGAGSISPAGPVAVAYGQFPTFTFTPSAGGELTQVRVDGIPVATPLNKYTFPSPIVAGHAIQAFFNP
jgi:hypothetical protein